MAGSNSFFGAAAATPLLGDQKANDAKLNEQLMKDVGKSLQDLVILAGKSLKQPTDGSIFYRVQSLTQSINFFRQSQKPDDVIKTQASGFKFDDLFLANCKAFKKAYQVYETLYNSILSRTAQNANPALKQSFNVFFNAHAQEIFDIVAANDMLDKIYGKDYFAAAAPVTTAAAAPPKAAPTLSGK